MQLAKSTKMIKKVSIKSLGKVDSKFQKSHTFLN